MSSTDEHILGTPSGKQLALTVTRRPEHKRWSKAFFCAGGLCAIRAEAQLVTQQQVCLTREVVERVGLPAGCKARAGRKRERARADAQAPEEALPSNADVLEVDDAQVAAQEAQAQANQQSSARAVVHEHRVLPSERSSQHGRRRAG